MKTVVKIFLSLLLANMCGCDDSAGVQNCEEDNAQQVPTYFADEFRDFPCALQNINPNQKIVNLRIRTQADYEKYFTCGLELPAVDFDQYFILAGRYRHNQCAVVGSQQVLLCNNSLVYKVRMYPMDCHAFTNVYYYVIIDRQYENWVPVFDVRFSN